MSFDDYVDQHIFAPLGMKHSTFRQPLPDAAASRTCRRATSVGLAAEPKPFEIVGPAPAGQPVGIRAPTWRKFMIAHLQNGAFGAGRILQARNRPADARRRR